MKTLRKVIYVPSRSSTVHLYHLTDLHLGARACDEPLLKRDIARIANDPFAYWIGGGDYIDCIARKGDRRYIESTLAPWLNGKDDVIGQQRDYAVDLLAPIADKCLGLVEGNHERAALDYIDRNIYWEFVMKLAEKAKIEPGELALGVQGFIQVSFRRGTPESNGSGWKFNIFTHHGAGGGRLPGGHALALGRILGDYDCDLALLGHRHVRQFVDKTIIAPAPRMASRKYRAALFVASYLDTFIQPSSDGRPVDTYPEHKMLPAGALGTTPIIIDPDAHDFHVVMSSGKTAPNLRLERTADAVAV